MQLQSIIIGRFYVSQTYGRDNRFGEHNSELAGYTRKEEIYWPTYKAPANTVPYTQKSLCLVVAISKLNAASSRYKNTLNYSDILGWL